MSKRITIKDIAKISGYSVNCVSRALMDAPDISEKTKIKIRQIADELGYVQNRSASSLRAGKSRVIGILFDSLLNPFYYIMMHYIWQALNDEGYSVVTFRNDSPMFSGGIARQILADNVDGLLSFLQPDEQTVKLCEAYNLPIVVIGRKTNGLCDCVYLDDIEGGRIAAQNFIERGFKKPMYLGENRMLACSTERGQGFEEEFRKVGIQPEVHYLDSLILFKWATFFEERIERGDLPDCIFCFSDYAAYEIISVMDRKNIKNIAVIGYDNIQKEIFMPGTLTSIDYDKKLMAETSVSILLNKINGLNDGHHCDTLIRGMKVSFTKPL